MNFYVYVMVDYLLGGITVAPLVIFLYLLCEKPKSLKRFIGFAALAFYLFTMYRVVGLPGLFDVHWFPVLNFRPFVDWGRPSFAFQMGSNVIMFMPLGFLIPLLYRKYRSVLKMTFMSFLISLSIETLQLFCYRATDIDDIGMNTLGGFLGYLCCLILFRKEWKKQAAEAEEASQDKKKTRTKTLPFWVLNTVMIFSIMFVYRLIAALVYGWIWDSI